MSSAIQIKHSEMLRENTANEGLNPFYNIQSSSYRELQAIDITTAYFIFKKN